MTDRDEEGEGFVGRWSRLKREARVKAPPLDAPPAEPEEAALPAEIAPEAPAAADERHELSDLPPLDSLDAASDYTGFLRREVPAELRRQALRKAWASDPAIAGFRGFAEYDWDFNAPGYGALLPTDDIARLVERIFPTPEEEEEMLPQDETVNRSAAVPPPQPSPACGEGGSESPRSGSSLSRDAGEG